MSARQGIACLSFCLLLVLPTLLYAGETSLASDEYLSGEISTQTSETDTAPTAAAEFEGSGQAGVDLFWLILKICGVLVLISGGIYGLVHLLKSSGLAGGGNDFMKVISSLPVGREKYLRIVRVGEQFLVIGVTEGSINRVSEIEDGETIQALKIAAEKNNDKNTDYSSDFRSVFQRFLGNQPSGNTPGSPQGSPLDEMQKKLKEISTPGESSL